MKIRNKATGAVLTAKLTCEHIYSRDGIPILVLSATREGIDPATWGASYELAEVNDRNAAALKAAGYKIGA
jgi:hypothetical protein